METTTTTITLPVDGDGTALKLAQGVSKFGLVKVEASAGTVMYVRDPDNPEENMIFEVDGAGPPAPQVTPPGTTVTVTLTYAGE